MEPSELPVLGICGAGGAGKTTLIEQAIDRLNRLDLTVVVVKHTPADLEIDRPGKDSARFFAAGADVFMSGGRCRFLRAHPNADFSIAETTAELARQYDVVLVEGYKSTPTPKVWLLAAGEDGPPDEVEEIIAVFPRDGDRLERLLELIADFLPEKWLKPPVLGCVLIGGKSSRMGCAKHLIIKNNRTWLERTAEKLSMVCDQVVIAGAGDVPECSWLRLSDVPGAVGPLAGILAAARWHPWATLLACACDQPDLEVEALNWLLKERRPGTWAVLPKIGERIEPLLALYDFRIGETLEKGLRRKNMRLCQITINPKVKVIPPPVHLHGSWRNVNCPEQL